MSEANEILEIKEEDHRVVVFEEALEAILFAAGHPIIHLQECLSLRLQ